MYKVGDKVLHQSEGACYITEIVERQVDYKTKQYFQLESVIDRQSTIYVSTEKHDRIRRVIDKDALKQSETQVRTEKAIWLENPKERYAQYKEKMEAFNFSDVMGVFTILTLENKKSKLHIRDEHLRKQSERLVCSEIAIILNKGYEYVAKEVTRYIVRADQQTA